MAPPLPKGVKREDLHIPSLKDAWPLAATLFTPEDDGAKRPAVVVAQATGVPARFYQSFAIWLASKGSPAITFDFRLLGSSFIGKNGEPVDGMQLSKDDRAAQVIELGRNVGMDTWGEYDYSAVAAFMARRFATGADRELVLVGNSLGGHVAPIAAHALQRLSPPVRVDRLLTLGSCAPYSGFAKNPGETFELRIKARHLVESAGYMDLGLIGWTGYPLPRLAALQWMLGCEFRNYIGGLPELAHYFDEWRVPALNLFLSDDFTLGTNPKELSPRIAHGFARILGRAASVESESERAFWEPPTRSGVEANTTGGRGWQRAQGSPDTGRRGLPSPDEEPGEKRRAVTTSSVFLDSTALGWLHGSPQRTSTAAAAEEDPRPKVIGHVDAFKGSTMCKPGSPSIELWELMRAFIQDKQMPGEEWCGKGIGGRRDWGPGGPLAVGLDEPQQRQQAKL